MPTVTSTGVVYFASSSGLLYAYTTAGTAAFQSIGYAPFGSPTLPIAPAIDSSGTVYIGDTSGRVYSLTGEVLRLNWYFAADSAVGSIAISSDHSIWFASTNGTLYHVSSLGSLLNTYRLTGPALGSPAITLDGTVYCPGGSYMNAIYPPAINPSPSVPSVSPTSMPLGSASDWFYIIYILPCLCLVLLLAMLVVYLWKRRRLF
jgi:outer membrane protein assembly factor BamB